MPEVEQVTDPDATHGEGPVWHAEWPGLRWVDMLAGDILELDSKTARVHRRHVGTVAAAFRPCADGNVVLALERGFAFADSELRTIRPLPESWSDPGLRMNDGDCSPDGHFYCGSMAYDEKPGAGSVHRLDPDGSTSIVLEGVTISNGLAWSPGGATAYYIDTPTRRVDAFDYHPRGSLTHRRTVVRIPEEAGYPDGMTIDRDGRMWIALWGGSAVRCYSPDGRLEEHLRVPATYVTACTFGGPELDELYITTSRRDVAPGTEPAAGALFRARPGVRGLPARVYGSRLGSS